MLKLYKRDTDQLLYHEAWLTDDSVIEHWGTAGTTGAHREHPADASATEESQLEAVLAEARASEFREVPESDLHLLIIEYAASGDDEDDADKQVAIEDGMNDTLGWTGLGHCEGGQLTDEVMEIHCRVIDFDIAKDVVATDLAGSEFADSRRIYRGDP